MSHSDSCEFGATPAKPAKFATAVPSFSNCSKFSGGGRTDGRIPKAVAAPKTCVKCRKRPVLGALSRCAICLKADAEADRLARERVYAGDHDSHGQLVLEAEADALLADPVAIAALEQAGFDLLKSNNARGRLTEMLAHECDRQVVAPLALAVHHTMKANGTNAIDVGLADQRNRAASADMANRLGRMFEAPVYRHEEATPDHFADRSLVTPPKSSFGREVKKRRTPPTGKAGKARGSKP